MKFNHILKQQFDYSNNNIDSLDYSKAYETIAICDVSGSELFFQGDDARLIFDDADNLYNIFTSENYYDCLILSLYSYVDLFQG